MTKSMKPDTLPGARKVAGTQDCAECRLLKRLLEMAVDKRLKYSEHVNTFDDSDPEKIWAKDALRGAARAEGKAQEQFNDHVATHARQG